MAPRTRPRPRTRTRKSPTPRRSKKRNCRHPESSLAPYINVLQAVRKLDPTIKEVQYPNLGATYTVYAAEGDTYIVEIHQKTPASLNPPRPQPHNHIQFLD